MASSVYVWCGYFQDFELISWTSCSLWGRVLKELMVNLRCFSGRLLDGLDWSYIGHGKAHRSLLFPFAVTGGIHEKQLCFNLTGDRLHPRCLFALVHICTFKNVFEAMHISCLDSCLWAWWPSSHWSPWPKSAQCSCPMCHEQIPLPVIALCVCVCVRAHTYAQPPSLSHQWLSLAHV